MSNQAICLDNAPMEPLLRSIKSEYLPGIGYLSITQEVQEITDSIVGYYTAKLDPINIIAN